MSSKTLADGRIKLVALTTKPADPMKPTVTELTAGVELSCRILHSDYRLGATGSDTLDERALCTVGNAVTYGASNYEGVITVFRYLTADGKADSAEDVAWDAMKVKGTHLWLYEREGPKHDAAWAAGDVVDGYEVITDTPQKPQSRSGYSKRTIPLGIQNAFEGATVAAAA